MFVTANFRLPSQDERPSAVSTPRSHWANLGFIVHADLLREPQQEDEALTLVSSQLYWIGACVCRAAHARAHRRPAAGEFRQR
jgi:hypothetical protein